MSRKEDAPAYLPIGRLLWLGPLSVLASIIAVAIVRLPAVAVLHPSATFMPLRPLPPILDTAALVIWAVVIFAAMTRLVSDPIRKFKTLAKVVLLFSFVPDILLATLHWFGGTLPYALALMGMHIVAWVTCVTMLTRIAPVTKGRG